MLGEVQSKCKHIANALIKPSVKDELHRVSLVKGARATTAIEGNTLTEEQVEQQIEGTLRLPPSKEYLATEVQNILDAFNRIKAEAFENGPQPLTAEEILGFNRAILEGLPLSEGVAPGAIRTYSVGIERARYRGAPAEDCKYLLQKLCDWINTDFASGRKEDQIALAVIAAILAHLYLAWIHPFGDGNGRTARLIEYRILLNAGVVTPVAHLLSDYYNETRPTYYQELKEASESGGDVIPFIRYAIGGLVEGLREQVTFIGVQQVHDSWINMIHDLFRGKKGATGQRRKELVLAISREAKPIPVVEMVESIPKAARLYAGLSNKTMTRDITALKDMNLIVVQEGKVYANYELMRAFLPAKVARD